MTWITWESSLCALQIPVNQETFGYLHGNTDEHSKMFYLPFTFIITFIFLSFTMPRGNRLLVGSW